MRTGLINGGNMNKPNFFITGSQKAGTTALQHYLSQHPQVYLFPYEIHYYDLFEKKGLKWYLKKFRKTNGAIAVGEKTPAYMYDPDIPEKIKRDFPDAKLIFMIRNPVKRAYSSYWMYYLGGMFSKSFEEVIFDKKYDLFDRGLYYYQLVRYGKIFPKDQMLVLFAEELKAKPNETMKKVYDFLNVNNDFKGDNTTPIFVGGKPRYEFIRRITGIVRQYNMVFPWDSFIGHAIYQAKNLLVTINKSKEGYPKLDESFYYYVMEKYTPFNFLLHEFVDYDDIAKYWYGGNP